MGHQSVDGYIYAEQIVFCVVMLIIIVVYGLIKKTQGMSNTKDYKNWIKESGLKNLTNTESDFANWLLKDENSKIISQIGDLSSIFSSVRKFLKS